jgi:Zn-dependent protease
VHPTFALLLAWVALSHVLQGHGASDVVAGVFLVLSIFACVVLHELSHALVARLFGINTRHIMLLPIGGVARLERMPERPAQELSVAIAGPVASFAIAGALGGSSEGRSALRPYSSSKVLS